MILNALENIVFKFDLNIDHKINEICVLKVVVNSIGEWPLIVVIENTDCYLIHKFE